MSGGAAKRVAIVGAGVSGLVAAAELHRAGHDVHVFDGGEYAGGHTNTVDVETGSWPDRRRHGVHRLQRAQLPQLRTDARSSSESHSRPADMSFSVSDGQGGFEWATRGPRGLFARHRNVFDPRFHRMLRDLVRFNREARALLGTRGEGPSLRRFLADGRYSEYFVEATARFRRRPRSGPPTPSSCGASRPRFSPSSSTTTACCSCMGRPRMAHRPRGVAALRRSPHRRPSATACTYARPVREIERAGRDGVTVSSSTT